MPKITKRAIRYARTDGRDPNYKKNFAFKKDKESVYNYNCEGEILETNK